MTRKIKPDEEALIRAAIRRPTSIERFLVTPSIYTVAWRLGIHPKRLAWIKEKWYRRGWTHDQDNLMLTADGQRRAIRFVEEHGNGQLVNTEWPVQTRATGLVRTITIGQTRVSIGQGGVSLSAVEDGSPNNTINSATIVPRVFGKKTP
jgi:hypothetical protein